MQRFMIDLETMGIRPTSAIVSVGATHFDERGRVLDKFYTPISLHSCQQSGLTTDQSTVDWWATQSQEARDAWATSDAPELAVALKKFQDWMLSKGSSDKLQPWGNGADFDLVLLCSAFRAIEADPPWKYYSHMCFRTVKTLYRLRKDDVLRDGTHHNALDDAVYQTKQFEHMVTAKGLKL